MTFSRLDVLRDFKIVSAYNRSRLFAVCQPRPVTLRRLSTEACDSSRRRFQQLTRLSRKMSKRLYNTIVSDIEDPEDEISQFNSDHAKKKLEERVALLTNQIATERTLHSAALEQKDIEHRKELASLKNMYECQLTAKDAELAAKDTEWAQRVRDATEEVKHISARELEEQRKLSNDEIEKLKEDHEELLAIVNMEAKYDLQKAKDEITEANADPYAIQKKKLEYIDLIEKKFISSAPDGKLDPRTEMLIKDKRLNVLSQGSTMPLKALSVSEVADSLGYALTRQQLYEVGKPIGKRYREIHRERPSKHSQFVDQKATNVNNYFEEDRWMLEEEIKIYWQKNCAAGANAVDT